MLGNNLLGLGFKGLGVKSNRRKFSVCVSIMIPYITSIYASMLSGGTGDNLKGWTTMDYQEILIKNIDLRT